MSEPQYKKDLLFASMAAICWTAVPFFCLSGIWVDGRWFWTALLAVGIGFCLAGFSVAVDKRYREKGVLK